MSDAEKLKPCDMPERIYAGKFNVYDYNADRLWNTEPDCDALSEAEYVRADLCAAPVDAEVREAEFTKEMYKALSSAHEQLVIENKKLRAATKPAVPQEVVSLIKKWRDWFAKGYELQDSENLKRGMSDLDTALTLLTKEQK